MRVRRRLDLGYRTAALVVFHPVILACLDVLALACADLLADSRSARRAEPARLASERAQACFPLRYRTSGGMPDNDALHLGVSGCVAGGVTEPLLSKVSM